MKDIIRDAPFGQIVRLITRNKFFQYPEEREGFQCPCSYEEGVNSPDSNTTIEKEGEDGARSYPNEGSGQESGSVERRGTISSLGLQRTRTLPYTTERLQVEQSIAATRSHHTPITPAKTLDGIVLADWYHTDDPANPQNWSQMKKAFVALQIDLYTFTVYCGSSIYVSSELAVIAQLGATRTESSLGLAIYVLGYGLGQLIWAPLSEIPSFGRNIPYIATFLVYMILTVPTALAPNLAGLIVCRFLQGFFGSPCLANGGASMQDMYSLLYLPYSVALWVSAMFAAPALGPILSGFAVTAENWRWSLWEILWLASPVFILWIFFLPETASHTILLHRAKRLRKISGNEKVCSQGEIDRKGLTASAVAIDAIIKPLEIMIKDPAVLFTNVYTALTYDAVDSSPPSRTRDCLYGSGPPGGPAERLS